MSDIAADLTHVELTWLENRIEHWIRFGKIVSQTILDPRRRVVSFAPGSIFAFVRWASNDFGTVVSRIDIIRAVAPGEAFSTVPFVRPGGDILLRTAGWPKVERVLQTIDAMEAAGIDPSDAAPDHWRHVHNRLTAGEEPRPYTPARQQRLASAAEGGRMTRPRRHPRRDGVWRLRRGASAGDRPVSAFDLERQRERPDRSFIVRPASELRVNDLMVVRPPEDVAAFLAEGGYLPRGVPLLKRVLALRGQTVCRIGRTITVDSIAVGEARSATAVAARCPSGKAVASSPRATSSS